LDLLLLSSFLIFVYTPPLFESEGRTIVEKRQKQTALKLCKVTVSPIFFMGLNVGRRRKNKREEWRRQNFVSKNIVTASAKNAGIANLASDFGVGWYVRQEGGGTVLVRVTDL
jgi:hypothetical protein